MICHSGGADGADTYFSQIGSQHGVETIHYYYGRKTPLGNRLITKEQLSEGWKHCLEANQKILHRSGAEKYKHLLARNWFQVKPSDAIFAISRIESGMVMGGTAWAVAMAVLVPKPTYVFCQLANKWFSVSFQDGFSFQEMTEPPSLTDNFAGIGSRELTPQGKEAIENLFKGYFP